MLSANFLVSVTVRLFMEGDVWVACGRELDIAGQGMSRQEALDGFCDCLAAHVILDLREGRQPLVGVPPWPLGVPPWDGEV